MEASPAQMEIRRRFKAILQDLLRTVGERKVIDVEEFDRRVDGIFSDVGGGDFLVSDMVAGISEDYFTWYVQDPAALQDYMRAYLSVFIEYVDRTDAHYPPDFDDALSRACPLPPPALLEEASKKKRAHHSGA